MPISTQCPGCGKKLTAKNELAGRRVGCPGCGQAIVIPATRQAQPAAATSSLGTPPGSAACPHCRTRVFSDGSSAGQAVACPTCGRQFRMPSAVQYRLINRPPVHQPNRNGVAASPGIQGLLPKPAGRFVGSGALPAVPPPYFSSLAWRLSGGIIRRSGNAMCSMTCMFLTPVVGTCRGITLC